MEFGAILLRFDTLFTAGLRVPAFVEGLVSRKSLRNCIFEAALAVC